MCLISKLDNEKVISLADEQTDTQTESQTNPVPYSNMDDEANNGDLNNGNHGVVDNTFVVIFYR